MADMLKAALWYQKNGFSVIPARNDKKPFVDWIPFQKERPTEVKIREWWHRWPNANIAIITGLNSGITVLDADSQEGKEAIEEYLPDTLNMPVVKTPRGWHYYFKYAKGVRNKVQFLTDCDIRSEGGYVIAPPSKNGASSGYTWVEGLSIDKTTPPEIPLFLLESILSFNQNNPETSSIRSLDPYYIDTKSLNPITNITNHNNHNTEILTSGRRDNDLFHIANCLVKGGMKKDFIHKCLEILAESCSPPFDKKDVAAKVKSAIDRSNRRDAFSMQEVRDWVSITNGNFFITDALQSMTIITKEDKQKLRVYLKRMVDIEQTIERVGDRDGCFRKVDKSLNVMNLKNVDTRYLDIKFPLDLHELFGPLPRNVIVIAGTPNVGKTAFLLNLARMNLNRGRKIRYFTSEMGSAELSKRLKMFEPEVPYSFWMDGGNIQFCDHSENYADKLDPDGINIIDYLEIPDKFWLVGPELKSYYDKLDKGVAVVALQKKYGQRLGVGGAFGEAKPRLYVTLESQPPDGNLAIIEKCKSPVRDDINPNRMECQFNVFKGSIIKMASIWAHPTYKEKKNG